MERIITSIIYFSLLILMVLCVIRFLKAVRKYTDEQMATRILRVTCRKCGRTFEGTQNSLQMSVMRKETSTTRTKIKGMAVVNEPEYSRYARKVFCPYCQAKEWADIHNVNEIAEENRKAVRPYLIRLVVRLLVLNVIAQLLNKLFTAIF